MLLERWSRAPVSRCRAVATALDIPLRDATIRAEGDLDSRTLGVSKGFPSGFPADPIAVRLGHGRQ